MNYMLRWKPKSTSLRKRESIKGSGLSTTVPPSQKANASED